MYLNRKQHRWEKDKTMLQIYLNINFTVSFSRQPQSYYSRGIDWRCNRAKVSLSTKHLRLTKLETDPRAEDL